MLNLCGCFENGYTIIKPRLEIFFTCETKNFYTIECCNRSFCRNKNF